MEELMPCPFCGGVNIYMTKNYLGQHYVRSVSYTQLRSMKKRPPALRYTLTENGGSASAAGKAEQ